MFFQVEDSPKLIQLNSKNMIFFFRPVFITICLARVIIRETFIIQTYFSIITDITFGIYHLQSECAIFFEKKYLERNNRMIAVINFISLNIGKNKMSLSRWFFPFLRERSKRSSKHSIPVLGAETSFKKFQCFLIAELENKSFIRSIFPDQRLCKSRKGDE